MLKAINDLKDVKIVGVDLEGILCQDGVIELIQFGLQEEIIIFDLHLSKTIDKDLYENILKVVKEMMEDANICKVFHDCRKDSLALHLFANCCPLNIFDMSGAHIFLEHLKIYSNFKEELNFLNPPKSNQISGQSILTFANDSLDVLKTLDDIKPPGLNDILIRYKAKHGPNQLKGMMKDRFKNYPREYFLQRPIPQEFLIYSARDVEDLPEMKKHIESELMKYLSDLKLDEDRAHMLLEDISKTYSSFGCTNY